MIAATKINQLKHDLLQDELLKIEKQYEIALLQDKEFSVLKQLKSKIKELKQRQTTTS